MLITQNDLKKENGTLTPLLYIISFYSYNIYQDVGAEINNFNTFGIIISGGIKDVAVILKKLTSNSSWFTKKFTVNTIVA